MPTRKKKAVVEGGEEAAAKAPPAEPAAAAQAPAATPKAAEPKAKSKAKAKAEPKAEAEAKAKAEAKAEPKAKPEAKAKAEPKAKAEGKAKAKAEGKAKAEAKAEPKAKAESKAKAKAKGEAKAEAKAKAEPKAEPKSKAKAGAKAAAAPAPEEAPLEEVVARKKRRGRKKAEEVEELEEPTDVPPAATGPSEEDLVHTVRIKSAHDSHHNDLFRKIQRGLEALPDLHTIPREEVTKEVLEQQKALKKIMAEVDETLTAVKISRPKNVNTGKIMEQMRELRLCKQDDGTFTEDTKKAMLEDLDKALSKSLGWESFNAFRAEMLQLKEKCEKRIVDNDILVKDIRSGNVQQKIIQRVANSKGVKVEDLNESGVVSLNVDLAPEVTSLGFLFVRKFEKQFGVVIDRPEGSKGSGKGSQAPPRSLVIRGLEEEAQACQTALRALDLSERKVIPLNPRQSAAMKGEKANARQLEEDFKGIFIQSERNQVTLYGPAKVVAACFKHIEGLLPDDSSAPPQAASSAPMTIDKDRARALIGKGGCNVQKIESETGTSIKVNFASKNDDDETPATVKITGEKPNADKAKDLINAFLKNLAVCLVEADAEVLARLYDSTRPKPPKYKGSGRSDDFKPSRFATLRDTSGLTVTKKAKGVLLVGDKAAVEEWKGVLQECVKEAGIIPDVVKLTVDQANYWTAERLEGVGSSSGAKVTKSNRGRGEKVLEITGSEEEKEKARKEIDEVNDRTCHADTIEEVSAAGMRALLAKSAGKVHETEKKHDVSIAVDRKAQSVKITGAKDAVDEAKKSIESILSSAGNITTKEVEIEWNEGRIIIGKSGSTVRNIKSQSGLEDLQVEGDENSKKKVVLRGSEEAVEAAEKMVQEALAKARSGEAAGDTVGAAKNGEEAERSNEGKGKGKGGKERNGSSAAPAATDSTEAAAPAAPAASETGPSSPQAEKPEKRYGSKRESKPDIESQELFPTLGGSAPAGSKQAKQKPKGSAWKTEDDADQDEAEADGAGEEAADEKGDAADDGKAADGSAEATEEAAEPADEE